MSRFLVGVDLAALVLLILFWEWRDAPPWPGAPEWKERRR